MPITRLTITIKALCHAPMVENDHTRVQMIYPNSGMAAYSADIYHIIFKEFSGTLVGYVVLNIPYEADSTQSEVWSPSYHNIETVTIYVMVFLTGMTLISCVYSSYIISVQLDYVSGTFIISLLA